MRKLFAIAAVASGFLLAACNPVTIPNPFGGAPLVLSGNLHNDLPGIKAYAADLKAGVKKDVHEVHDFFVAHCNTVYAIDAEAQSLTATDVANAINGSGVASITQTAAEKQLGNVQEGTGLAKTVCDGGSATDIKTVVVNFAQAAEQIVKWLKPKQPAAGS